MTRVNLNKFLTMKIRFASVRRLVNLCHVAVQSALLISYNKVKATDVAVTLKVKTSKNRNMNIAISR